MTRIKFKNFMEEVYDIYAEYAECFGDEWFIDAQKYWTRILNVNRYQLETEMLAFASHYLYSGKATVYNDLKITDCL